MSVLTPAIRMLIMPAVVLGLGFPSTLLAQSDLRPGLDPTASPASAGAPAR